MASGTDTAIAEPGPTVAHADVVPAPAAFGPAPDRASLTGREPDKLHASRATAQRSLPRRTGRWRISPLTRRILALNVLAIVLLAAGFLYLGKYESSLITQQIESLRTQGEIFAAALGEGAVDDSVVDTGEDSEILLPDLAKQMMRRLVEPTRTRARLYDADGHLIADSRVLRGSGDAVQVLELPPPDGRGLVLREADRLYDWLIGTLPHRRRYPTYTENATPRAGDYPEVMRALRGEDGAAVRSDPGAHGLMISVAVPVQRYKQVLGAVMLSTGNGEIEQELRKVRLELLRISAAALLVTVLLSLYLASSIVRPIRLLAAAAERVRGRNGRVEIPDFTGRGDEIGDLSRSLREMTDAIWRRISTTESFAADVAHEIKNPLGSLRSAVETAARIEDPAKQRRLMAIILDDVERLDRLITDISDASRLDAEMSRLEPGPVDIGAMLRALAEIHQTTRGAGSPGLSLDPAGRDRELVVPGIESRLSQVFRNVIANAASFSPETGEIRLAARPDGRAVLISVEDDGPGIPADKLTAIFDRFYTERPAGEKFGTHSGLGLSISKQIVEAHRGRIWAENRLAQDGRVVGARFLIRLPAER